MSKSTEPPVSSGGAVAVVVDEFVLFCVCAVTVTAPPEVRLGLLLAGYSIVVPFRKIKLSVLI